jgi:hypothetical protein
MTDALEALKRPTAAGTRPVIDTSPEKPHRCLSHLHWFARDRDLAWEHARLAVQKLGGTDSAELAMARLRILLLHSPAGGRASRLIGRRSAACSDRQRIRSVMNSNYLLILANSSRGDTLQVTTT